jgi:hypothetical protein
MGDDNSLKLKVLPRPKKERIDLSMFKDAPF